MTQKHVQKAASKQYGWSHRLYIVKRKEVRKEPGEVTCERC